MLKTHNMETIIKDGKRALLITERELFEMLQNNTSDLKEARFETLYWYMRGWGALLQHFYIAIK